MAQAGENPRAHLDGRGRRPLRSYAAADLAPVPELAGLQKRSYEAFLQARTAPEQRLPQGLDAVLRQAVALDAGHAGEPASYAGYRLDAAAADGEAACRRFGRTYAARLNVRLLRPGGGIREEAVGEVPLMTARGTFVIAGHEKVVIGCLRAEGDGAVNDLTTRRLLLAGDQLREALADALAAVERRPPTAGAPALMAVADAIAAFFAQGRFTRAAEDTNPLTLVSHLRRVVQTIPDGEPGYDARGIHPTHFGRLCLLETPEGERIGCNLSLALFADVDAAGRLLSPYRRPGDPAPWLLVPPGEDDRYIIGDLADPACQRRYADGVLAKVAGDLQRVPAAAVELLPVHPVQGLGASASLIPLVAHDDANRALMGTNMQKQAVPLLHPQAPLVLTGMEADVAQAAGAILTASCPGTVKAVEPARITVSSADGTARFHDLPAAPAMPGGYWQALVQPGDAVSCGQPIAGGPATDQGILALGRNLLVGYLSWEGYNFEDGVVVSDRVTREEYFDSVKVLEFTATQGAGGVEHFGAEHLPADLAAGLGPDGIVAVGAHVAGGAVLVARYETGAQGARLDRSLRLPIGQQGTVATVEHYRSSAGDRLAPGVTEFIRVTVTCRRPLQVGDKLCNRHGAKGVVSLIVPEADMPMLPDGRHLEALVSPLGLPSRMNLGSILEAHLGMAAHTLGCSVVTPGFGGATVADIEALLVEAGLPKSGMFRLTDGRTGRPLDQETTVGYVTMMKLEHLVADKCQARNRGPYASDTGQPVAGRRHGGGQRLGLMESWALQGHGTAQFLHELLTVASDDVAARAGLEPALIAGQDLPAATVPHGVRRLVQQLRGLCLDVTFAAADGTPVDPFSPSVTMAQAATAALRLATPEAVLAWSAGAVTVDAAGGLDREALTPADGLTLRHLRLSCPVQHPWRELVTGGGAGLPALAVLPVLPQALCPGLPLAALYGEVAAANAACRSTTDPAGAAARLQRAVDALGRALTRCLHGKRGWITAALSGKAADYSGRSVVCPGPDLAHDTCSLPIAMAAVLFEPWAVGALLSAGQAGTAEAARTMLAARHPTAMAALQRVTAARCVVLHRAPVLHRLGMQAFRVRLADEEVIRVHPLTLVAFNADFDGDEMDVFVPLSAAAQAEVWANARSSRCQLSPANGAYVAGLTQDMVLGCYYATCTPPAPGGDAIPFTNLAALAAAHAEGRVGIRATVVVDGRRTTAGRALLNQLLPSTLGWFDGPATKTALQDLLARAWHGLGAAAAAGLGDALMRFGFHQATLAGLSLGKDTFHPFSGYADQLASAWEKALQIAGPEPAPVAPETRRALLEHWMQVADRMAADALAELAADRAGLNPLHLMLASGARGSRLQVRQHIAMRGPMTLPDGRVLAAPVTTSFIRGHSPLEYLAASFGARRGLADTAIKTADAGHLFKCVMNAVQDVTIVQADCGCTAGLRKAAAGSAGAAWLPLAERIAGRTAGQDVRSVDGKTVLVAAGEIIGAEQARALAAAGIGEVWVRSPVTCRAEDGVCAACYGLDLATWQPSRCRQAIGVVAAQSLGEPATQLTMRTFHPGAEPARNGERADIVGGLPRLRQLFEAWNGGPDAPTSERHEVHALAERDGVAAAAEYLLVALQKVYREQGVRIDDRHLEVVLRRMLCPRLRGVSAAAAGTADFVVAGAVYGGIPALAAAAARGQRLELDTIRRCMVFGKRIPAPPAE